MDFLKAGLVTGFLGDIGLQVIQPEGLRNYFREQGPLLSVLKASALTGFWSGVFGLLNPTLPQFVLLSGAIDQIYRIFYPQIYPSLSGYYESYPWYQTIPINMAVGFLVYQAKLILTGF